MSTAFVGQVSMWLSFSVCFLLSRLPLCAIPWRTNRGKQCFWRLVWRFPCILPLHCMYIPALPHWSQTLYPYQATCLLLMRGKFVLHPHKNTHSRFNNAMSKSLNSQQCFLFFFVVLLNSRCLIDSVRQGSSSKFFPKKARKQTVLQCPSIFFWSGFFSTGTNVP